MITVAEEMELNVAEAEAFLRSHGWVKVDPEDAPSPKKVWQDPQTGRPPEKRIVRQDRIDNETRTIRQNYHTAPAGYYTLVEAVQIQDQRNNNGRAD